MSDGLDVAQFRTYIVRPTLEYLGLDSAAAENLLVGTALTESRLKYLHQLGDGPAQGVFQMEPATEKDIWGNYLAYRPTLAGQVDELMTNTLPDFGHRDLIGNLYYQAAMCRIHYLRVSEPLPAADDAAAHACYWKNHYNTHLGAGTVKKALPSFQEACA